MAHNAPIDAAISLDQAPLDRAKAPQFASRILKDPRDWPFIPRMLVTGLVSYGCAAALFVPGVFSWPLAAVYLVLMLGVFMPPYLLMLHNTSHRPLFRKEFAWMNNIIPYVLGPLLGQSPRTYYCHHIGMHHPENNLQNDRSSTMRYQRDSFVDFLKYSFRFLFVGGFELHAYLRSKARYRLARSVIIGELTFIAMAVSLSLLNWRAALVVLVIPFVVCRFAMMSGNWGQHAFIDPATPGNEYRNSITCVGSAYNRRCYNDGYHISHHLKASAHWTEAPGELQKNLSKYAENDAILFRGIDFFVVWFFLMLKRYDWLAKRCLQLEGNERTREELVAWLRSRTRPILSAPASSTVQVPLTTEASRA